MGTLSHGGYDVVVALVFVGIGGEEEVICVQLEIETIRNHELEARGSKGYEYHEIKLQQKRKYYIVPLRPYHEKNTSFYWSWHECSNGITSSYRIC